MTSPMRWMRAAAAAGALAWGAGVLAQPAAEERFYGYAYDLASGRYLYTEVHRVTSQDGRWRAGTTAYHAPDGSRIGLRRFDFASDPWVPVYGFELPSLGYSEGVARVQPDGIELHKTTRDKGRATARVPHADPIAADCGFHPFIVDHLGELAAGRTVRFRLAVAGQLDAYGFRARKTGDTTVEGRPAIRVVVEPDSLLRLVVDPIALVYDPASKRLLEYRGVSNVIDPTTGEAHEVRIVYAATRPADAPANLPPLE